MDRSSVSLGLAAAGTTKLTLRVGLLSSLRAKESLRVSIVLLAATSSPFSRSLVTVSERLSVRTISRGTST